MKFGKIDLQVNLHWLMELDVYLWRHTFKVAAMMSFHPEKCCHLVSALAYLLGICCIYRLKIIDKVH